MKTAVSTQVLIQGLVRSPDREGALAHFDPERGFAFVARGAMGFADVIDPTIWIKEKLALALTPRAGSDEPPLRRAIGTLRSVHGELMARSEAERTWISVLVVLLMDGEGMALIAGDCPCYRFRAGILSRLGRSAPENLPGAPTGSLGSDTQVKLEMVPLNPQSGDCYILSTHPLREGELSLLARDLSAVRDPAKLVETACAGTADKGRVAIAILFARAAVSGRGTAAAPPPLPALPPEAPPVPPAQGSVEEREPDEIGPLEIEPIEPVQPIEAFEATPHEEVTRIPKAAGLPASIAAPQPAALRPAVPRPAAQAVPQAEAQAAVPALPPPPSAPAPPDEDVAALRPAPEVGLPGPPPYGAFAERRPWYEWAALWGGGALAIVALALLIRAILPGILGTPRARVLPATAPLGTGGTLDLFSDPPGASVRIDGVPLESRTPATDVSVAPGRHRVEMNWGVYGAKRDTVEVAPGGRVTLRPRLLGSVGFKSSDPVRVLDVYVDGAYMGSTPVVLDSVVVGRHLVRFGGPGLNTTAQEVEVLQGTYVELFGNAGPVPEKGRVTVRSAYLSDTGFEAGRNDPVWVDGEMRGVTPLTVELKPGSHSFRVVRRQFPPQISVIDVRAGGEQFVAAEFGEQSAEPLRFAPPSTLSRSNPLPLTISLPAGEWDQSMVIWVFAAPPGGTFQARRMTRVDEASKSFAALLPPEVLRNASRQVKIYFKAVGAAGRELFSEIYTIPVRD